MCFPSFSNKKIQNNLVSSLEQYRVKKIFTRSYILQGTGYDPYKIQQGSNHIFHLGIVQIKDRRLANSYHITLIIDLRSPVVHIHTSGIRIKIYKYYSSSVERMILQLHRSLKISHMSELIIYYSTCMCSFNIFQFHKKNLMCSQ